MDDLMESESNLERYLSLLKQNPMLQIYCECVGVKLANMNNEEKNKFIKNLARFYFFSIKSNLLLVNGTNIKQQS